MYIPCKHFSDNFNQPYLRSIKDNEKYEYNELLKVYKDYTKIKKKKINIFYKLKLVGFRIYVVIIRLFLLFKEDDYERSPIVLVLVLVSVHRYS